MIWNIHHFDKNGSNVWNPKPDESLVRWADFVKSAVSGWWIVGGKVWANHSRSTCNYQLINVNNVVYFGPGYWNCLQFSLQLSPRVKTPNATSYLKLPLNKHLWFHNLQKVASYIHSIPFNCELCQLFMITRTVADPAAGWGNKKHEIWNS